LVKQATSLIKRLQIEKFMNNRLIFFACLIGVSLSFSCNRNLIRPSLNDGLDLKIEEFDFDYLKAKAKFEFKNGKNDLKANANIRIKKDSLIWMSISASLGIEGARTLITQDSMVVIDRLNKQYTVLDYKELSEKYNFQINYDLLQSVLLGNLSSPIQGEDKVSKELEHFLVLQDRGSVRMENYIGLNTMKLERAQWLDLPTQNTLTINYTNFQRIEGLIFPYKNKIVLEYIEPGESPLNTQINIEYNRAEISDKKERFPFNIPQKYERK